MELIEAETNKFAENKISAYFETAADLPPKSRLHQWSETTVAELYRLIAVMILMGMCVRGRVDEYWSTGTLGMPGFRTIMSKDRFLLLMRFLHFVDNDSISCRGPERKLAKIKPVLDHLNAAFKAAYTPRREVSIDESLLLWKGHLSWIQCIRTKAARFGIKSYELCEAVTGYVLNIIIYTGKEDRRGRNFEPPACRLSSGDQNFAGKNGCKEALWKADTVVTFPLSRGKT
ncbi:piggyBac transposable element-derived protein 4-like [Aricia agestis]|uniref:piggyBac transposable element-derived protein 4-like n=1 Tax=Aricia agestis TaxID=91739 RepID=UPI001C205694|nr:piggyBac transposable element-derived protein 4-like [Aricia agestis]